MILFQKRPHSPASCPADTPGGPGRAFCCSVSSDVGRLRPNNEDNYILDRYMNEHSQSNSQASLSLRDQTGALRVQQTQRQSDHIKNLFNTVNVTFFDHHGVLLLSRSW